jgi:hypothetical protein
MHGNNTRTLSVSYSLSQISKMLCFSYYLLCFFFNKIREQEGGTVLPGRERRRMGRLLN